MGIFDTPAVQTTPQPTGMGVFESATPFDAQEYQNLPPTTAGLQATEIRSNPDSMQAIRDYMLRRKGEHMSDYSDEELYDTFVNHMR